MAELILISAIIGGASLLISVTFWNIRRSRCTSIECNHCCKIKRELMDIEEMKIDTIDTSFPYRLRRAASADDI